jgi:23S rRNA (uracil1939-C5)-methyltransferase
MGIPYATQLEWKKSFVTSALRRIGKLADDVPVEILPSPALYEYRNRVLLRLHWTDERTLRCGYFRRQTRELVPITRCEIAASPLNGLITAISALSLGDTAPFKVRLELQQTAAGAAVTEFPAEGPQGAQETLAAAVRAMPGVAWAGLVYDLRAAPLVPFDEQLGVKFATRPGQFQQVNAAHNQTLRAWIKERVEALKPARVLDVFCGSGNLSLPLADGRRYVEGVELNKDAIEVAKTNAAENGLTNVNYLAGDAEKHLWKCMRGNERFDLVLLDPPRQGLYKGMVPLRNIAPETIIYVSCDPTTLARDLGYLTRKDEYLVTEVLALDFFPNTFHVETVAVLRRNRAAALAP